MKPNPTDTDAAHAVRIIQDPAYDVSGKYMAVGRLKEMALSDPGTISAGTADALGGLLWDKAAGNQTQAYFLFREAALALCELIARPSSADRHEQARRVLTNHLGNANRHAHRAAAEALGSLPLDVRGPDVARAPRHDGPRISLSELLDGQGIQLAGAPRFAGRSMVAPTASGKSLLVIKMARSADAPDTLNHEAHWMAHLRNMDPALPVRFEVPAAIRINGGFLFRLKDVPPVEDRHDLHPERWAVAFLAHPDYFTYPNDRPPPSCDEAGEIILRNAWLLGRLTAMGIVHTAPIPLFHNRAQQHRREDRGLYQWTLRGRLDKWLSSCAYPNVGRSGPRDFEHLDAFKGKSRDLYDHIGAHLLSLLLVAGSYFRSRDPERVGLDERGRPVDARDLFDARALEDMVEGTFLQYYDGFVGAALTDDLPFDQTALTDRMIEEMGVDRHMEEVLRAHDQERMTDEAFVAFLLERGFGPPEIARLTRGREDIVLITGPHLGGFNDRISLPELIDAVESMTALCVCGKYCAQSSQSDHQSSQRPSLSRSV
ncbi:MAG: SidJ-related pseudokinase [Deltaproteobacteria bacterium]|nr:SidJ-related pseudokinase [Deltaproteobacteria bacterium]